MRAAIYARVSTKLQSVDMQLTDLRKFAENRGMSIVAEFVDLGISGSKESRPQLDRLMLAASRREFDCVLVWRFDRMARSTRHLISVLEEFDRLKIAFISHQENLDTGSPMGKAMFSILAAFGQLERDIIRERVTAGVRKAREKRSTWGRPCKVFTDPGGSIRNAVEITGVNRETIRRHRLKNGYRYVQVDVPEPTPQEQP